jgi:hypothetical protein
MKKSNDETICGIEKQLDQAIAGAGPDMSDAWVSRFGNLVIVSIGLEPSDSSLFGFIDSDNRIKGVFINMQGEPAGNFIGIKSFTQGFEKLCLH